MENEITAAYSEALTLHTEIMANANIAGNAFVEMCKGLKKMRDAKMYEALGYEDFESYCEQMAGFKARQGYNYISAYEQLGKDFLTDNASLGITKLNAIAQIPALDREEFLEEHDVEDMTARELKETVDKLTKQGEQLSLLEEENAKLKTAAEKAQSREIDELKRALAETEKDLEKALDEKMDLSNKTSDAENERERLKKRIDEITKIAAEKTAQIEELEKRPIEVNAEPSTEQVEQIRAEVREQTQKEAEQYIAAELKKQQDELAELKAASEETELLRKKLAAVGNNKAMEFKIYFEDAKTRLAKMFDTLTAIEDKEMRGKLGGAFIAFLSAIKQDIEDMED